MSSVLIADIMGLMKTALDLLNEKLAKLTKSQMARDIGVSRQYIGQVLAGDRPPGPLVLAYLGMEKQITYRARRGR